VLCSAAPAPTMQSLACSLLALAGVASAQYPAPAQAPAPAPAYGGGAVASQVSSSSPDLASQPCPHDGFFAHPTSCSRFYRCVDHSGSGKSQFFSRYLFQCPSGQVFAVQTQTCVTAPCEDDYPVPDPEPSPESSPDKPSWPVQPSYQTQAPAKPTQPSYQTPAPAQPSYQTPAPAPAQPAQPSYQTPAPAQPSYQTPASAQPSSQPSYPGVSSAGSGYPSSGASSSGSGYPSSGASSSGSGYPSSGASSSGSGYPSSGASSSGSGYPSSGASSSGSGYPSSGASSSGSDSSAPIQGGGGGYPSPGLADAPQQPADCTVDLYVQDEQYCNVYHAEPPTDSRCPEDKAKYQCIEGSVFNQARQMCLVPYGADQQLCHGKGLRTSSKYRSDLTPSLGALLAGGQVARGQSSFQVPAGGAPLPNSQPIETYLQRLHTPRFYEIKTFPAFQTNALTGQRSPFIYYH